MQQWALDILTHASQSPEDGETWAELNSRRMALIRKRYEAGLSEPEAQELAKLQDVAAAMLEPFDRRRRQHIRSLVHDANPTVNP